MPQQSTKQGTERFKKVVVLCWGHRSMILFSRGTQKTRFTESIRNFLEGICAGQFSVAVWNTWGRQPVRKGLFGYMAAEVWSTFPWHYCLWVNRKVAWLCIVCPRRPFTLRHPRSKREEEGRGWRPTILVKNACPMIWSPSTRPHLLNIPAPLKSIRATRLSGDFPDPHSIRSWTGAVS